MVGLKTPTVITAKNLADPHESQTEQEGLAFHPVSESNALPGKIPVRINPVLEDVLVAELCGVTERHVRRLAAAGKYPDAQKRLGNGGQNWSIPLSSLPQTAQARYWLRQTTGIVRPDERTSLSMEERDELWKRWEKATPKCRARAEKAFAALKMYQDLPCQGFSKMAAYQTIQEQFGVCRATFNSWQEAVKGLDQGDWRPALVPDFPGRSNARRADWPGDSWRFFLGQASTPKRPLMAAYHATVREAQAQGWGKLPSRFTAARDFRNLDADALAALQGDDRELERLSPTIQRDYSGFALHEQWSMDGRRLDVQSIDAHGLFGRKGWKGRLWMYAIMDMRSRYLVGYAFGQALNADLVRHAILDALDTTRRIIPQQVQADNGMEAAAKEITGGAPWRLRGKVKEDEPIGLLPMLGIRVSWATPAHGQTKPIERLFGTLARKVETRPEFRKAYMGHNPVAWPEEFDKNHFIPVEALRDAYQEGMEEYHHSPHRGDAMDGKTPRRVYEDLMRDPGFTPKRLTERQYRMCLLPAVAVTLRRDGCFTVLGHAYWSEKTAAIQPKGRGYFALYNPQNLSEPVFLYRKNKLIAENVGQVQRAHGNSKEDAQQFAKAKARFRKTAKAKAQAETEKKNLERPEIRLRGAQKHPELIDKETGKLLLVDEETGELLPLPEVTALTPSAVEAPKAPTPEAQASRARIENHKKLLEEIDKESAAERDAALAAPRKKEAWW
jgi:transposase InsO family protein